MLLCALLLGLRRGEIVALKWSDINFRTHSLSVNKSVYKEKGAPQQLKPPKSQTSIRTVYFSDVLLGAFEEWKAAQAQERATAGFDWKEQDYIFTNEVGDMISLYTPSRICSKFEEKNGLHHLKFHGLRHTCGSLMASNGVDPETVKTVLGYDSIETTNLERRRKADSSALAQIGLLISNSQGIPTVKRIRKTAQSSGRLSLPVYINGRRLFQAAVIGVQTCVCSVRRRLFIC